MFKLHEQKLGLQFDSLENVVRIKNSDLVNPDSLFGKIWTLIMMALLLYTAIIMPFKVSFYDDTTMGWMLFDTLVDFIFLGDVIINLNTPYFNSMNKLVTNRKMIFLHYLFTWLLIDLTSSLPIELIQSLLLHCEIKSHHSLLKLARLPRIYRLIRITRLLRTARLFSKL